MVMTVYQQPSPLEVHVQPSRVVGIIDERFPAACRTAGKRWARHPVVYSLPPSTLQAGLVEHPAGAPQQGDLTPY